MSELINNREARIATLKSIIQGLHAGADPEEVKRQLKELVKETDSTEIAAMEQELIADGMPVSEVQGMCDLHASVLREITVDVSRPVESGHPIDTFRRENEAILAIVGEIRRALGAILAEPTGTIIDASLGQLRFQLGQLGDIEKHYRRKENLIFSCLERHFITGPSKVMWGKDDEVRALLKTAEEALTAEGVTVDEFRLVDTTILQPMLEAVSSMVEKETLVLLPMVSQVLTEKEWGEIWLQSPEYGWCLVEPQKGYQPPAQAQLKKRAQIAPDAALVFETGNLDLVLIESMFRILPVDITIVDADDRVRFFSEGPDRVFARSKAIIGRKVQHCHPPKSVHIIEQILNDFRAGRQNLAEFWIQLHGAFVHIRYLAMRDLQGNYLGTLEVTQDLTRLRALTGERRLLEYDAPTQTSTQGSAQ